MRVAVCGQWHMGRVFATIASNDGNSVVLYDDNFSETRPSEPNIVAVDETSDPAVAMKGADVVWIAWDTPIENNDAGNFGIVMEKARALYPYIEPSACVIVSSQVPVGTTEKMRTESERHRRVDWVYVPENLRLGNAVQSYWDQRTVAIGRETSTPKQVMRLFRDKNIIPMSIRSAELSKHAVNCFLACQIALTNELAWIAEDLDADARDVEKVLRSDPRIGPKAYVRAGAPFAGGTLGRDLRYLTGMSHGHANLPSQILASNMQHDAWIGMQLEGAKSVAVWGVSYKGSTNTMRGSITEKRIGGMLARNIDVRAVVSPEPHTLIESITGADALLLGNEHPSYHQITADQIVRLMKRPFVVDPSGYLRLVDCRIDHRRVGVPRGKA